MLARRPFGNHDFDVSVLGLGAGPLGDTALSDEDAFAVLDAAVAAGIDLFDTAPSYGDSEARIGRFLASRGLRHELKIATKLGYGVPGTEDWTGPCIAGGIDLALSRLGLERLDLALLHSCPPETLQREDVLAALEAGVSAGKIRVAGYSGDGPGLRAACQLGLFGAFECSVSLVDQEVLRAGLPAGAGVLAKRVLMNGVFARDPGTQDDLVELHRRYAALPAELRAGDVAARALRFAAHQSLVSSALVGTRRPARITAAIEAFDAGPLPESEHRRIEAAWDEHRWPGLI